MGRPLKPAAVSQRKPFFGEWSPVVVSTLLLGLGLAAVTTFYASVFAAAHAVAAESGGGREQFAVVTLWVCALFLLQGMLPILRFGVADLPRLVAVGFQVKARDAALFVVLLIAGAVLLLT